MIINYFKSLAQISFARIIFLFILLSAGIAASVLTSENFREQSRQDWLAQAEEEAQRLTSNFAYSLDFANAPIQTITNLFNSSGNVSGDESTRTVDYLSDKQTGLPPPSMGFLTVPRDANSDDELQGWIVTYTTEEDGILMQGSDASAGDPTRSTIAAALSSPDTILIGPAFDQASGSYISLAASTVANKMQSGVVISLLDYRTILDEFNARQIPPGMSLRLEAAFSIADNTVPSEFVYGKAEAPTATLSTLSTSSDFLNTQLNFHWDFSNEFMNGAESPLAMFSLYGGILTTILLTLFLGALFALSARAD